MHPDLPTPLLGGLTPAQFMRRHWQRSPLLIRGAFPDFRPPLGIPAVKRLARQDDVESRLIWREHDTWQMESGPFARLPSPREREWTVLVQGVNLHDDATAALMQAFRFIPDARLDDVMISVATDGGGVGPHVDSYDVFLLQGAGRRRWRIGRQDDLSLEPGLPLKILRHFAPTEEYVLEPGDMLYLPPHYAHDGIAEGDCMTLSIGFRSPSRAELARGMLEAAADMLGECPPQPLRKHYTDRGQPATDQPAALPQSLVDEAVRSAAAIPLDHRVATRFLGCWLTEPKPNVVFDPPAARPADAFDDWPRSGRWVLDRRTLMIYRGEQLFINGEQADISAGAALRALADHRRLDCASPACRRLSPDQRETLLDWHDAGWLHWQPSNDQY